MMDQLGTSELKEVFDSALGHGIKSEISCLVDEDNKFEVDDDRLLPIITDEQNYEIKQEVEMDDPLLEEYCVVKEEVKLTENEQASTIMEKQTEKFYVRVEENFKGEEEIEVYDFKMEDIYKEEYNEDNCMVKEKVEVDSGGLEESSNKTLSTVQVQQHILLLTVLPSAPKDTFICKKDGCCKSFPSAKELSDHELTCENRKPVLNNQLKKCIICSKSFNRIGKLQHHLRSHTGEKPYTCDLCNKSFISKYHLKRHLSLHTGKDLFKCNICNKSFNEKSNLTRHLALHSGEKPYKCNLCPKSFSLNTGLKQHLRVHSDRKRHKCNICNRIFNEESNLVKHLRVHASETPYKCNMCTKLFSSAGRLARHLTTHSDESYHEKNCTKLQTFQKYSCTDDQSNHQLQDETGQEIAVNYAKLVEQAVEECNVEVEEKFEDTFECNIGDCCMSFTSSKELSDHELKHKNPNESMIITKQQIRCEVCSKSFSHSSGLIEHLRTHPNEKSYKCSLCGKSFVTRSNFTRHLKLHSDHETHEKLNESIVDHSSLTEQQNKCKMCNKSFSRRSRTHTAQKSYTCSLCGKSFCRRFNFIRHKRNCTQSQKYSCTDDQVQEETKTVEENFIVEEEIEVNYVKLEEQAVGEGNVIEENCKVEAKFEVDDGPNLEGNSVEMLSSVKEQHSTDILDVLQSVPEDTSTCNSEKELSNHENPNDSLIIKQEIKCEVCSKSFNHSSHLIEHLMTHPAQKSYKCSLCGKSFSAKFNFTRHLKVHPELSDQNESSLTKQQNKCEFCCKSFTRYYGLIVHLRTHSAQKSYKCGLCGKSFGKRLSFKRHLKVHSGESPHQCSLCSKSFSRSSSLRCHKKNCTKSQILQEYSCTDRNNYQVQEETKTVEENFKVEQEIEVNYVKLEEQAVGECNVAVEENYKVEVKFEVDDGPNLEGNSADMLSNVEDQPSVPKDTFICKREDGCSSFTSSKELPDHALVHEKPNESLLNKQQINCEMCSKSFSHISDLIEHVRTHPIQISFKCSLCAKSLSDRFSFVRHLRLHSDELPYQCYVCNKSFRHRQYLTRHLSIHSGEKLYKCNICTKSFTQHSHLAQHLRTHSGEKPYECISCKKSFREKARFTAHLRLHSGEMPFKCNLCNKSYNGKSSLKKHLMTHTGEKPHTCELCNKSFTEKAYLKIHSRVHTGIKPYICDVCPKSFTKTSNLLRHLRIHSGIKPYECNYCNKSFTENSYLTKHLKVHSIEKLNAT